VFAATDVLLAWACLGLVHLRDRYQIDHASGTWVGLAWYLNHGVFYPEVFDGEAYGGTRYMPLQFVVQAGLARLTGDYLLAGKALSLGLMALGCLLVYGVLRRAGCDPSVALALVSLMPASDAGLKAGLDVRGDLLPVLWQVGTLAVAARGGGRARAAFAGVLCTLAVLTKASALWAPAAVCCYHWHRDRRFVAAFAGVWLGTLLGALGLLHLASGGRMLANFGVIRESGGAQFLLALRAPLRLLRFAAECKTLLVLTPFALAEWVLAFRQRRMTVYHWAGLWCVGDLLVVFGDRGTIGNHLIDLVVLEAILVGHLWSALGGWEGARSTGQTALAAGLVWGVVAVGIGNLGLATRDALAGLRGNASHSLPDLVGADEPVLAEDASVCVALGQRPILLDPWALAYLEKSHPAWTGELARRVHAREFGHVFLKDPVHADPETGMPVDLADFPFYAALRAVRDEYRFERRWQGLWVYARR
jgi:hypothetical protein